MGERSFNGGEVTVSNADCKTYYKKACDSGSEAVAPTPAPVPSPTPVVNPAPTTACYGALEAVARDEGVGTGELRTSSLSDCKDVCAGNSRCNSFAFYPQYGGCWFKERSFNGGEVTVSNADCKTYYKKACDSGSGTPVLNPAPAPATTASPQEEGAWKQHPATNCWEGNGADGIAGKNPLPNSLSLSDCKKVCEAEPSCDGIVVYARPDPVTCWLRTRLTLNDCVRPYNGFDTWER